MDAQNWGKKDKHMVVEWWSAEEQRGWAAFEQQKQWWVWLLFMYILNIYIMLILKYPKSMLNDFRLIWNFVDIIYKI